jgi:hypothetical protein
MGSEWRYTRIRKQRKKEKEDDFLGRLTGIGKSWWKARQEIGRNPNQKSKNDSTSSKIDRGRSRNSRFGRSRSWNWNSVRSIHYRNVTKPFIGSKIVPIYDYGIRFDRSDCIVRIDDGVLDFVYILIKKKENELR